MFEERDIYDIYIRRYKREESYGAMWKVLLREKMEERLSRNCYATNAAIKAKKNAPT